MRYLFIAAIVMTMTPLGLTGCIPAHYRANPTLPSKAPAIKRVVLLEPDIKVYEVSAGGVKEEVKGWSTAGTGSVFQAMKDRLTAQSLTVIPLKRDDQTNAAEVKDMLALYDAVVFSIFMHTYNAGTIFKDKQTNFDYSVGSLESVLQKYNADALVIVNGEDTVATKGKIAVEVLGVLTGVPLQEPTWMMAALAAKNGDLLWFDSCVGSADLQRPEGGAAFVARLLKNFPELGK